MGTRAEMGYIIYPVKKFRHVEHTEAYRKMICMNEWKSIYETRRPRTVSFGGARALGDDASTRSIRRLVDRRRPDRRCRRRRAMDSIARASIAGRDDAVDSRVARAPAGRCRAR